MIGLSVAAHRVPTRSGAAGGDAMVGLVDGQPVAVQVEDVINGRVTLRIDAPPEVLVKVDD